MALTQETLLISLVLVITVPGASGLYEFLIIIEMPPSIASCIDWDAKAYICQFRVEEAKTYFK
jgi:hypothetical protein